MTVRGFIFQGSDFDSLEPADPERDDLSSFTLNAGQLCGCAIDAEIPVAVVTPGDRVEASLLMHLELGKPAASGGIDREELKLRLKLGDRTLASKGTSGWFEDEMLDLQSQMPPDSYIKACINCAFSDYSPAGHGLFGWLACFRDNKQAYLAVRSKSQLFRIWDTMTELVQETYLCPEFRRRAPGAGYRG